MSATSGPAFTAREKPIDWDRLKAVDVAAIESGKLQASMRELEALYDQLVSSRVREPEDDGRTRAEIVQLFRVSQLVMEMKDRMWLAAERSRKEEVEKLESELEKAYEEAEMSKAGEGDGGGEGHEAAFRGEELRQLRQENAKLSREAKIAVSELQKLKLEADALAAERKKSMEECALAQRTLRGVEDELEVTRIELRETKAMASTQQSRLASTMKGGQDARSAIEKKTAEASKYAREVEALSKTNRDLEDENVALKEEVASLATSADQLGKKFRETKDEVERVKQLLREAEDDKSSLQARLHETAKQLEDTDTKSKAFFEEAGRKLEECKLLIEEKTLAIEKKSQEVARLQQALRSGSASQLRGDPSALMETWAQGSEFQAAMKAKNDRIQQLEKQVQEFARTVEQLNKEIDSIEGKSMEEKATQAKQLAQTATREGARMRELEEILRENNEQMKRYEEEIERCAQDHAELIELRHKVKRWESGVDGLAEANDEIRALKASQEEQAEDMSRLAEDLNKHMKAVDELREENLALREKLGMTSSDIVDTTGIRLRGRLELEQLRALNEQYKEEIKTLEEDRSKSRAALRTQALENAEKAVKLGLSTSDLKKLEEYADRLREGKEPNPQEKSRGQLVEEIQELRTLVERTNNALTLAQLDREELADELRRALASGSVGSASSRKRTGMLANHLLYEENQKLKDFIAKNITKVTPAATQQVAAAAAPTAEPQNSRLIQELEAQKKLLQDELDAKSAELSRTQFEGIQKGSRIKILERQARFRARLREANVQLPDALARGTEEDVSILNEQLVECLEQLARQEEKSAEMEQRIVEYRGKFEKIREQLGILYGEHVAGQKAWESEREAMRNELSKAKEQVAASKTTVDACESLLKGRTGDTPAAELASLKIKSAALGRQCEALEVQVSLTLKELSKVRSQAMAAEQALQERCAWLEAAAREAAARLKRAQDELDHSVSRREHEVLTAKYEVLLRLHGELLETESSRVAWSLAGGSADEPKALRQRLSLTEAELRAANERTVKLQAALDSISSNPSNPSSKVAELSSKVVELTVAASNSAHMAEISKQQLQATLGAQEKYEARVKELEKQLMEVSRERRKELEEKSELSVQHSDCIPADQTESMRKKVSDLELRVSTLSSEIEKHRELTSISVDQVAKLRLHNSVDSAELESLRATVNLLQGRSGSSNELAALSQKVRSLQANELELKQKLEEQKGAIQRLNRARRQLEEQLRERSAMLEEARTGHHAAMQELYALLDQKQRTAEGSVERSHEAMSQLRSAREATSAAEQESSRLRARNALLEAKVEVLEEEAKRRSGSSAEPGEAVAQQAKLEAATLRRQLDSARERERWLTEANARNEETIRRLEEQAMCDSGAWERRFREAIDHAKSLERKLADGGSQRTPVTAAATAAAQERESEEAAALRKVKRELGDAEIAIADRDARLKELRKQVEKLEAALEAAQATAAKVQRQPPAAQEAATAQEMVRSLQAMVRKKDEAIEKYQKSLAEAKEQHAKTVQELELQIAKLTDKSFEDGEQVLQRMKADLEAASKSAPAAESKEPSSSGAVVQEEVKKLLEEKEDRVRRREETLEAWRKETAAERARLDSELQEAKRAQRAAEEEVERLKRQAVEAEELRQQLAIEKAQVIYLSEKTPPASPKVAAAAASKPTTAAKSSLTPEKAKLLKGQVAAKEKKIQSLEACIEDLRKQLLEQAQIGALKASPETAWAEKLATAMATADGLRSELAGAKAAKQRATEAKDGLQAKLEQVQQESGKQAAAAQRQRAELERAAKELTETKAKVAKLQEDLREARARVESHEAKQGQEETAVQRLRVMQLQLATTAKTKESLKEKLAAKTAEVEQATAALKKAQGEVAELKQGNEKLRRETLAEKNAKIAQLEARCHELEEKGEGKAGDVGQLEQQLAAMREAKASTDAAISQLRFERDDAVQQAAKLQKEAAEMAERLKEGSPRSGAATKRDLEEARKTIEMLTAEASKGSQAQGRLVGLEKEVKDLREKMRQRQTQATDLGQQSKRASDAWAEAETLRKVLKEREGQLASQEGVIKELEDRMRKMISAKVHDEKLAEENEKLRKETAELRSELGSLDPTFFAEIAKLKEGYKEVVRKNQLLEEKLRKLGGSSKK